MSFWVTSCHSLAPRSWPSYFLSSSIPVMVVMRYRLPGVPGPLLVADAPHLLYRAFYALPDSITGPDDQPVNALLGSVNALLQVVEQHKPRTVVLCFGAEAADYRTEAYRPPPAAPPPRPPAPPPDARRAREPVGQGARVLRGVRMDGARPRRA